MSYSAFRLDQAIDLLKQTRMQILNSDEKLEKLIKKRDETSFVQDSRSSRFYISQATQQDFAEYTEICKQIAERVKTVDDNVKPLEVFINSLFKEDQ